jgi:hypothetical protein
VPELPFTSQAAQPGRCRRYVGSRGRSRDGECGLAAKVVIDGEPLCYVHTPVAYRRALWSAHPPTRASRGESA